MTVLLTTLCYERTLPWDGALSKRYLWPMPKPVPWNVVPPLDQPVDFAEGSPTEVYKQLW